MSIRYYLKEQELHAEGLRGVLLTGKKATFEDFLDHCEDASTIARADALAVVEKMADWISAQAASGREVDFGPLGYTRLGMKGTFTDRKKKIEKDDYDITVGWSIARALQKRVNDRAKSAGLRGAQAPVRDASIVEVVDLVTKQVNVYSVGNVLELRGGNLKFDVDREDEGVFFQSRGRKTTQRAAHHLLVFPKRVQAVVPADLVGEQRVLLRYRRRPDQKHNVEAVYPEIISQARA